MEHPGPGATHRCELKFSGRSQSDEDVPFRYCSMNSREADRVRSNPLAYRDYEHVYGGRRLVMERESIAARARLNEAFTKKFGIASHRQRFITERPAMQTSDDAPFAIDH